MTVGTDGTDSDRIVSGSKDDWNSARRSFGRQRNAQGSVNDCDLAFYLPSHGCGYLFDIRNWNSFDNDIVPGLEASLLKAD
jgi:hypothetical protein